MRDQPSSRFGVGFLCGTVFGLLLAIGGWGVLKPSSSMSNLALNSTLSAERPDSKSLSRAQARKLLEPFLKQLFKQQTDLQIFENLSESAPSLLKPIDRKAVQHNEHRKILVSLGYIQQSPTHLTLTTKGKTAGGYEAGGIPVPGGMSGFEAAGKIFFPIGQRAFVEITGITDAAQRHAGSNESVKAVLFTYSHIPNAVGSELLKAGAEGLDIDLGGRINGDTAYFRRYDDGWRFEGFEGLR